MNRDHKPLAIVEDDMAELAAARMAVYVLWQRLATMAKKTVITLEDIDCFSEELRIIEHGLAVTGKYLSALREEL